MSAQAFQAVLATGAATDGRTARYGAMHIGQPHLSQDLGLALRRLRASLRACSHCPAGTACPLRVDPDEPGAAGGARGGRRTARGWLNRMVDFTPVIRKLLSDPLVFAQHAGQLTLRSYQQAVARAVVDSVVKRRGLTIVIMFPRQSGKNELQAQLETYLLMLYSEDGGELVKVSPTWKPQAQNAMRRLERVLEKNLLTRGRWEKASGYLYRVGQAQMAFFSGAPEANIVGATASLLLEVDEAQDVSIEKYDRAIAPMAASTNATRVLWGTAWTGDTLAGARAQDRPRSRVAGWSAAGLHTQCRGRRRRGAGLWQTCGRTGGTPGPAASAGSHAVLQRGTGCCGWVVQPDPVGLDAG